MKFNNMFKGCCVGFLLLFFVFTGHASALKLKVIANGMALPIFVTAPPGDTNRLFVVEQHSGKIRIINLSTLTTNTVPFLQISGLTTGGEQGLLGLAFHPGYATNGYFYVNFTTTGGGAAGHTEIARYTVSSNPDVANVGSKFLILSFNQPESNHNGGWLGFGLDGYLYIATGDGGGGNDRHGTIGNGQNQNTLLGKILRIDVNNGTPYSIPDGNPYKGDLTKEEEIWAFGLRNPWRCSVDRQTGDIWIGDVGQGAREEIDFIPANTGGLNFGWRPREGFIQNPAYTGSPYPFENPVTTPTDPIHDIGRSDSTAVTGGYVYRGSEAPGLNGTYFFADYGSARIWTLKYNGSTVSEFRERTSSLNNGAYSQLSSFGEDALGELYICSLQGRIYKIISNPVINQPVVNAGVFRFTFDALGGQPYTVRAAPAVTGPWQTVTNFAVVSSNSIMTFTDPVSAGPKFYRVSSP